MQLDERETEAMLTWCEGCGDDLHGLCISCQYCGGEYCRRCIGEHEQTCDERPLVEEEEE